MIHELKHIESSPKKLRDFGFVIGLALAIFTMFAWWRTAEIRLSLLIPGLLFVISGFWIPTILRPFFIFWMIFSQLLGWLSTRILLVITFYLILTPFALISRLFGQHWLDMKIDTSSDSYWVLREQAVINKEKYKNQF
jgi:hypothetical protein